MTRGIHDMPENEEYANIRGIIGEFVGQKVLDITQHDEEYFKRTGRSFVDFMFDSGDVLRIYITGGGICMSVNPDDETEEEAFKEKD